MSTLRHGPPLAMNGYMDKEGRKFRARKTRYFRLKDSALFNHRRKDSLPTWGVSLIDSRVAVGHKSEVIVQLFDGKKLYLYPHSRSDCDRWVDLLQRASRRKIGNYYGVTGLVGMGSFAEVRVGYDKSTGQQVAIKVMKKNKRDSELMRSIDCEMNFISKNIDHDNIVATYDVFDTRDNLFIVMEYMPGGMLYDILANEGCFTEKNAASVMKDLLYAVDCLHQHDIVHRDIKPENVLALNKTWPLKVKLADFGLADFVLENSFGEKSTCGMYGTPFFVAPEVIRAETYTPAVDIWSLGVLAYNMLSGKLPFDGNNIKEVLRRVRLGRYSFPDSEWAEISPEAKDFISGLLEVDPKRRLTAQQALVHTWLTSTNISERIITNDRSALGYEQRKLRMSSMAIDDVAGLLRLDDEDEAAAAAAAAAAVVAGNGNVNHHADHGIRALSRLFPGGGGGGGGHGGSTPVGGGSGSGGNKGSGKGNNRSKGRHSQQHNQQQQHDNQYDDDDENVHNSTIDFDTARYTHEHDQPAIVIDHRLLAASNPSTPHAHTPLHNQHQQHARQQQQQHQQTKRPPQQQQQLQNQQRQRSHNNVAHAPTTPQHAQQQHHAALHSPMSARASTPTRRDAHMSQQHSSKKVVSGRRSGLKDGDDSHNGDVQQQQQHQGHSHRPSSTTSTPRRSQQVAYDDNEDDNVDDVVHDDDDDVDVDDVDVDVDQFDDDDVTGITNDDNSAAVSIAVPLRRLASSSSSTATSPMGNGNPTTPGGGGGAALHSSRQHHQHRSVDSANKVSVHEEDIPSLNVSPSDLPPGWATGIHIGATKDQSQQQEQGHGHDQFHGGGLAYNVVANGPNGFALPAILSVKDIMRRRHEAEQMVDYGGGGEANGIGGGGGGGQQQQKQSVGGRGGVGGGGGGKDVPVQRRRRLMHRNQHQQAAATQQQQQYDVQQQQQQVHDGRSQGHGQGQGQKQQANGHGVVKASSNNNSNGRGGGGGGSATPTGTGRNVKNKTRSSNGRGGGGRAVKGEAESSDSEVE